VSLLETLQARARQWLPGHLGIRITHAAHGRVDAELDFREAVMAANGFLHAGTVVSLADTAAGFGCMSSLPEGATGFTTIELKTSHVSTAREGTIACTATLVHGGRMTQVWDAVVTHANTGKTIALYRCTQMVLYPKG